VGDNPLLMMCAAAVLCIGGWIAVRRKSEGAALAVIEQPLPGM
jgi:hypothetical protein